MPQRYGLGGEPFEGWLFEGDSITRIEPKVLKSIDIVIDPLMTWMEFTSRNKKYFRPNSPTEVAIAFKGATYSTFGMMGFFAFAPSVRYNPKTKRWVSTRNSPVYPLKPSDGEMELMAHLWREYQAAIR